MSWLHRCRVSLDLGSPRFVAELLLSVTHWVSPAPPWYYGVLYQPIESIGVAISCGSDLPLPCAAWGVRYLAMTNQQCDPCRACLSCLRPAPPASENYILLHPRIRSDQTIRPESATYLTLTSKLRPEVYIPGMWTKVNSLADIHIQRKMIKPPPEPISSPAQSFPAIQFRTPFLYTVVTGTGRLEQLGSALVNL